MKLISNQYKTFLDNEIILDLTDKNLDLWKLSVYLYWI